MSPARCAARRPSFWSLSWEHRRAETLLARDTVSLPSHDRFGPLLLPSGVRFQVWAPRAKRVALILDAGGPKERRRRMQRGDDDFFTVDVEGAGPGTRYLYERSGGHPVPDPASRFQPDGVNAPSEVVDLRYDWTADRWGGLDVERWVIYELHVGTFSPERTYDGVRRRLDHLQALGITAIELMPLAAFSGQHNWGYDGVFHFAPFAGYGAPADLQRIVHAAHDRGIAVIVDVVTNHFGPEGNAMWSMAKRFFRTDRPTAWGPGIDWSAEPVLGYFDEVARSWLRDYNVDGLRLDAFHAIPAGPRPLHLKRLVHAMRDARPDNRRPILALLESSANQTTLLGNRDGVQVAQLNFDLQRSTHALLTDEGHGPYGDFETPLTHLVRCVDRGFSFLQRYSPFYDRVLGDAPREVGWDSVVNFIQNHDTCGNRYLGERLDRLTDAASLRAATALLLLHPGIPFLFMGQEWQAGSPFFFFTDFSKRLGRRVTRGRLRSFREIDPSGRRDAPGPQEPAALLRSTLDWNELNRREHAEALAWTRSLIEARKRWVPEMSRRMDDVSAMSVGDAALRVTIDARAPDEPPFVLLANFGDEALPIDHQPTVLLSTTPSADPRTVPPRTTQLRRLTLP